MMGKQHTLLPLLIDAQWKKAIECVLEDRSCAKKWITTQSFTGNLSKTEILPIHQACAISTVRVDIVETLTLVYPESLLLRESGTLRTPLHVAIRARVPNEVIAYLMNKCPESISLQDSLGRVPLHYACSNQLPELVINSLVEANPESVRACDTMGWTPLHVASSLYQSVDVVKIMVDACPEAVLLVTKLGTSTDDAANTNESNAKESIVNCLAEVQQKFLETPAFRNIREAEKRDELSEKKRRDTPLYTSLRSNRTWGVRKRVRSNSVRCVV